MRLSLDKFILKINKLVTVEHARRFRLGVATNRHLRHQPRAPATVATTATNSIPSELLFTALPPIATIHESLPPLPPCHQLRQIEKTSPF
jgi:hypothetical protein